MEPLDRRRTRKRGIVLASVGLLVALAVTLALTLLGLAEVTYADWIVALVLTFAVQAVLWYAPHRDWDTRFLAWDRHYLYVPMVAAAFLLNYYIYLAPMLRTLGLMGWFVALLFMAGLAGFVEVVVLGTVMGLVYLATMALVAAQGETISLAFEVTKTAAFLVVNGYAGIVYERLRRDRREMQTMREQLAELALTDALTELPNRRHFEEILRAELARIRRYGGRCALAMIDVDHFKDYNDGHGHLAGDMILRELATVMRRHLRISDVLARYGGEEFALIMVNASKEEAYHAIDRLRMKVEEYPFPDEGSMPGGRLTVSAGIAGCPEDGTSFEELVRCADEALYTAKRKGRNRVQVAVA